MLALFFLSNAAEERIESLGPLHRIVPETANVIQPVGSRFPNPEQFGTIRIERQAVPSLPFSNQPTNQYAS